MEKIESYNQCNLLIKAFRKGSGRVTANFFFLPKELQDIIEKREMKYQESKETLIFCIEENDFSHIFYFAKGKETPVIENAGKVMILDLVSRDIENSKEIKLEEERWQAAGFREYKRYVRLKMNIEKASYINRDFSHSKNYELSCAEHKDMDAVLALWRMNLDKYSTPLPKDEEMGQIADSGHVYVVRQRDIVVGAVYMDAASKSCVLNHLAVHPSHRRQGLGTRLMDYALRGMALEGIEKCHLWVDVHNMPAYESYKKYGFEEDGLWSKQLRCD